MTEEVSSKLSLLTRKLAEVGQLKGEIADKLFEEADAGIITKEQALEILDTYNLLPTELRDYIFTKTSLWLKPTNEK